MHYLPHTIPDVAVDALKPAADESDAADAESWVKQCRDDMAQLWRDGDFWMVTEIRQIRSGMALHIVAASGQYKQSLVDEAEAWAKSIGCSKSFFTGRRGWEKKIPSYKLRTITMEKEL
jgi:hypothetical protein